MTATTSPGFTPPRLTAAPNPVEIPQERRAAARRSYHGSTRITEASWTTMYSANVPRLHMRFTLVSPRRWRHVPSEIIGPASVPAAMSQIYGRPEMQYSHLPHEGMNDVATWSPTLTDVTPSPTASTTPEPSCPPMIGNIVDRPDRN